MQETNNDPMNPEVLSPETSFSEMESPKRKKKRKKIGPVIWGIFTVLFMCLTFFIGMIYGRYFSYNSSSSTKGLNIRRITQKLSILEECVDQLYYNDVTDEELESGIYQGFMSSLKDPYSTYYTAQEYKQLMDEDSGEYKGIGITVIKNTTNNYTEIVTVNKGDPAYNAGIKVGDFITKVNGHETQDMTLTEVVTEIKTADDPVTLTIYRDTQEFEIKVEKSTIVIDSVEYEMKEGDIGYISVSQFLENTDEKFEAAVDDLEAKGMRGLVIDLRDDGGGMLDSCINMVSRIIPKDDLIVYTKTKDGTQTDYTSNSDKILSVPIVILVNGNSASASEIFTGCLKDYSLAKVIGTTTFGKGIVQSIIPLSDGSALKLTVSGYYTPNGNDIHKKGIEPDEVIEISDDEWKEAVEDPSTDKQLKRAIEILKEGK